MPVEDSETPKERRTPGAWKGRVRLGDDFDAPLPRDIAEAFGAMQSSPANPYAPPSNT